MSVKIEIQNGVVKILLTFHFVPSVFPMYQPVIPINSDAPYAPFERITEHATNGIIRTGYLISFFSKEIMKKRKSANHTSQVVASGGESESKWKGSLSETVP